MFVFCTRIRNGVTNTPFSSSVTVSAIFRKGLRPVLCCASLYRVPSMWHALWNTTPIDHDIVVLLRARYSARSTVITASTSKLKTRLLWLLWIPVHCCRQLKLMKFIPIKTNCYFVNSQAPHARRHTRHFSKAIVNPGKPCRAHTHVQSMLQEPTNSSTSTR